MNQMIRFKSIFKLITMREGQKYFKRFLVQICHFEWRVSPMVGKEFHYFNQQTLNSTWNTNVTILYNFSNVISCFELVFWFLFTDK